MSDESIFTAALAISDAAGRGIYLDRACSDNPALRRDVEGLLAAHAGGNPLDRWPLAIDHLVTTGPTVAERPGTQIGPYKLLQQIGDGGMGVVYMAEQSEPIARRVAL